MFRATLILEINKEEKTKEEAIDHVIRHLDYIFDDLYEGKTKESNIEALTGTAFNLEVKEL